MSIIGSNILAGASGTVETGYQISRSLRFNSADSAYLSRTPSSATNRKTWTWSGWVKRSELTNCGLFGVNGANDTDLFSFRFDTHTLKVAGSSTLWLQTTQVFRDPSSHFHLMLVVDTTQATAANRLKIYVNGSQITAFSTAAYPTQNADMGINRNALHNLGCDYNGSSFYNGLLADIYFIDGQALDPTSFGETDATTGVWVPKAYTATYGTNGFWLKFDDNSGTTATTLGKDSSGNGNNWTPNNFSVTAGVGNDSMVDSPTWYGTDTGAGGEVRGNYCTLNPLNTFGIGSTTYPAGATLTNGNLDAQATTAAYRSALATLQFPSSGKYYFEVTVTSTTGSGNNQMAGIASTTDLSKYFLLDCFATSATSSRKIVDGTTSGSYSSVSAGTVIGVAVDCDNSRAYIAIGNTWIDSSSPTGGTGGYTMAAGQTYSPAFNGYNSGISSFNFGQRPFAYTAPSGFKALCTTNLPTPAIGASASTLASKNFDITTYTGTNTTKVISGFGFQPDFLWFKNRAYAAHHAFVDVIRGVTKQLQSSTTNAESTNSAGKGVQSFNSDGFTLGQESDAVGGTNDNTAGQNSYVTWMWKAGGTAVSNTAGSITSQVSANAAAGISVVTYTGTGANATVGHGLGVAPKMIIFKDRTNGARTTDQWPVYHASLGATKQVYLNATGAAGTASTVFNDTAPTSSVFSVGSWGGINYSTDAFVAYCFAEVPGFSKFGSYTGNGSADGPFVYCGFRPRFIMIKRTDSTSGWVMIDTARDTYNYADKELFANLSNAEASAGSSYSQDVLSNGFKIRRASDSSFNASGGTYIFAAFAESPFNYSRAR